MEEIISLIEDKIARDIRKGSGSVNYNWEEILSLIEEKVAGDRISYFSTVIQENQQMEIHNSLLDSFQAAFLLEDFR